jgi:phage replication-related protein YjqB (UPF0714/DUF867 family)
MMLEPPAATSPATPPSSRAMFADLLAAPGVVEHCELRSSLGFMALHGGLEASTFEIASACAAAAGASLYAVVQPGDLTWHVPSHRYSLADSDALRSFCAHVDVAISLHGYGGVRDSDQRWLTIVLGGGDRDRAASLGASLRAALPDYVVIDDLEAIPPEYRGIHPDNPVNRCRGGGVQIELPPRVRGTSPVWAGHDFEREPFVPHTRALIDALVATAGSLDR